MECYISERLDKRRQACMSLIISPQKDWRMDLGLCNASALINHDEIAKVKASCRVSNLCEIRWNEDWRDKRDAPLQLRI
jgi:hypothetical protein